MLQKEQYGGYFNHERKGGSEPREIKLPLADFRHLSEAVLNGLNNDVDRLTSMVLYTGIPISVVTARR